MLQLTHMRATVPSEKGTRTVVSSAQEQFVQTRSRVFNTVILNDPQPLMKIDDDTVQFAAIAT